MAGEIHRGSPPEVPPVADSMARWVARVAADREATAALVREGDAFVERSWGETLERARTVAEGLLAEGLEPGDRLGIRAETCYEWSVVDLAACLSGLVLVPVYPSFSGRQARHVVEDAGVSALISDGDPPEAVASAVEAVCPLSALPTDEDPRPAPDPVGGSTAESDDGTADPESGEVLPGAARAGEDPATIVYTSGTTGDPKGVTLTHHNLLSTVGILTEHIPTIGDRATAFLPLSHVYQRLGNYHAWHRGAAVAYMSPDDLAEELTMVRPTGVMAVPRLYERIHDRIEGRIESADGPKGWLLAWAVGVAREYGRATADDGAASASLRARHAVADRLVFSTLRGRTGLDAVEFSVTGAASIDPEILYFFRGMGVPLLEG